MPAFVPARVSLVTVAPAILSSYGPKGVTGGPRGSLVPLHKIAAGRVPQDVADALLGVHEDLMLRGVDFRVTDCLRDIAQQATARSRYNAWVSAGKPATTDPRWDPAKMKNAFVAIPGESFHNGGRAIDVDTAAARFAGTTPDRQLDRLWEVMNGRGWRQIIDKPTEGASESWHFDYMGPWAPVHARRGYAETAMCAVLDIGGGGDVWPNATARAIQAHLHRAGYDVGKVDGEIGPRTGAAMVAAGVRGADILAQATSATRLPSSPTTIWKT